MQAGASVLAMAILLAAATSNAFDAGGADIIGLRLGMPQTEIVAALRRQGFAVAHDHGMLSANTRDGQLTVDMTEEQTSQRIRYVFTGNGAGERQQILASILGRFGQPDQAKPMAWCRAVGRDGVCPEDEGSLVFLPETLTLVLQTQAQRP